MMIFTCEGRRIPVSVTMFLGVHISNKLEWSKHTKTVVKRVGQHIFPHRRLKRFGIGPEILKRFYSCTIESMTGCITAWYGNCSASPPFSSTGL